MQRKRAFTLIELLVVIAIIAILAAILFPVFAKARERAKQSQSLNNAKQLTLGVMQYAQDYDETFPGWVDNTSFTGGTGASVFAHNTWDEQINSQIKSPAVFNNGGTGIKSPSDPKKERVLGYVINGALIAPYLPTTGEVDWRVTAGNGPTLLGPGSVSNPAETILFAEAATDAAPPTTPTGAAANPRPASATATGAVTDANGTPAWQAAQPTGTNAAGAVIDASPMSWVAKGFRDDRWYNTNNPAFNTTTSNGVARDFYGGGGTYGFVDGHVKFMKVDQTVGIGQRIGSTPVTAANWFAAANTYNMWNPNR